MGICRYANCTNSEHWNEIINPQDANITHLLL
jgi:hypothetical protein